MKIPSTYLEIATTAAQLERDGDYAAAALEWHRAENATQRLVHIRWAQARRDRCVKAKHSVGPTHD